MNSDKTFAALQVKADNENEIALQRASRKAQREPTVATELAPGCQKKTVTPPRPSG
jgi:hypothetical protein